MSVHNLLKNKFSWYRKWHENKISSYVHFIIFFLVAGVDFYLAYQLQIAINYLS